MAEEKTNNEHLRRERDELQDEKKELEIRLAEQTQAATAHRNYVAALEPDLKVARANLASAQTLSARRSQTITDLDKEAVELQVALNAKTKEAADVGRDRDEQREFAAELRRELGRRDIDAGKLRGEVDGRKREIDIHCDHIQHLEAELKKARAAQAAPGHDAILSAVSQAAGVQAQALRFVEELLLAHVARDGRAEGIDSALKILHISIALAELLDDLAE